MKIMKPKSILIIGIFLLMLSSACVDAQQTDNQWQFMLVREDKVKPSSLIDYENGLFDMKSFLEENKVEDFFYFTHLREDYTFMHITTIDQLSDLNKGIFEYVKQKVNKPEFELIWSDITASIDSYRYYLIKYSHDLSYVPETNDWEIGLPFRKWNYYYFKPGTDKEVKAVLAAWRQLYKDSGIKNGFRVFAGSIGLEQPLFVFATWAEDPQGLQINLQENMKLLGDRGAALNAKMLEYVERVESYEGWYLPQYSYNTGQKLAAPK